MAHFKQRQIKKATATAKAAAALGAAPRGNTGENSRLNDNKRNWGEMGTEDE